MNCINGECKKDCKTCKYNPWKKGEKMKYFKVTAFFEKRIKARDKEEAKDITQEIMENEPNYIEWTIEEIKK